MIPNIRWLRQLLFEVKKGPILVPVNHADSLWKNEDLSPRFKDTPTIILRNALLTRSMDRLSHFVWPGRFIRVGDRLVLPILEFNPAIISRIEDERATFWNSDEAIEYMRRAQGNEDTQDIEQTLVWERAERIRIFEKWLSDLSHEWRDPVEVGRQLVNMPQFAKIWKQRRRILSESTRKGPALRRHRFALEDWINRDEERAIRTYENVASTLTPPVTEDENISDSAPHDPSAWLNLSRNGKLMVLRFEGRVIGYCPSETARKLVKGEVRVIPLMGTVS